LLAFVVEGTVQFYPPSFSAVNKTVSIEPLPCDLSIRVTNAQQRMRSDALNLAIEIPPGFGRDAECGRPVQISAWIDGAMPTRGEMIRAYVVGMHQLWLSQKKAHSPNVGSATAMGLLMSSFMSSQTAAIFGTAIATIIPASQYSGFIEPVSSLEGIGAATGRIYPTAHFLTVSRGTFPKALGFADLQASYVPLLLFLAVLMGLGIALLKKQET
jgi:hypothetical protein